jgi:hypothetical protein
LAPCASGRATLCDVPGDLRPLSRPAQAVLIPECSSRHGGRDHFGMPSGSSRTSEPAVFRSKHCSSPEDPTNGLAWFANSLQRWAKFSYSCFAPELRSRFAICSHLSARALYSCTLIQLLPPTSRYKRFGPVCPFRVAPQVAKVVGRQLIFGCDLNVAVFLRPVAPLIA